MRCNLLIGKFNVDVTLLESAIKHLRSKKESRIKELMDLSFS
ncbi:MAG: hypothetical protein CMP95_06405 [Gammaproteobacteria bacterium]|nr:hypothetical protein [Gammaproteobacteria bacterium]